MVGGKGWLSRAMSELGRENSEFPLVEGIRLGVRLPSAQLVGKKATLISAAGLGWLASGGLK